MRASIAFPMALRTLVPDWLQLPMPPRKRRRARKLSKPRAK
jgi:hypothetical protein